MFDYTLIRLVGGLSGILLSVFATRLLMLCKAAVPLLTSIGAMTLPIYVLHQKFMLPNLFLNFRSDSLLLALALSVVIVAASVGVYRILRRNRILALVLFGE